MSECYGIIHEQKANAEIPSRTNFQDFCHDNYFGVFNCITNYMIGFLTKP